MLSLYNEKLRHRPYLKEFNSSLTNLQFTIEEQNNNIYFLDITILKVVNNLSYNIYRKQYIMLPHTT
jgi:hypothetical protein